MRRSRNLHAGLVTVALCVAASPVSAATTAWIGDARAAVRLVTARDGAAATPLSAGLEFRFAPGWHGYWRTPGDAGIPPAADWSCTEGLKDAVLSWPAPHRLVVAGLQNSVYEGRVLLPAVLTFAAPDAAETIHVAVDYAACGNVCVPYHADLSLTLPAGSSGPSAEGPLIAAARDAVPGTPADAGIAVKRQTILGSGAERRLTIDLVSTATPFAHPDLFVENAGDGIPAAPNVVLRDDGRAATLTVSLPASPADDQTTPAVSTQPLALTLVDGGRSAGFAGPMLEPVTHQETSGLWTALLSAFVGGFILNLMPCVLPVLSLKLAGLARQAGEGRRAVRLGFAATALGIVTSFLIIATALIVLQRSGAALGWGIQFQQPWFLAMLAAVTTIFAASLFDWVHIGIPAGIAGLSGGGSRAKGVEAFLTGAFATLLATPCSAPFVGTAVGFALARGPSEILGIFLGLGLGMASPFIAAALRPGVARWLPRPGRWMVGLRRILGLLLGGTTVWLLVVLSGVAGPLAAAGAALPLAGLLALFARRAARTGDRPWTTPVAAGLVALAVAAAVAIPVSEPSPAEAGDEGMAFDPASIDNLVADGRTIMVDVSASWCLTCKVNELAALKTAAVRARLARPGTIVMRADWSRADPTISRYIQSFGRYGLPLDVVYGPGRPRGEALPELLTATGVIAALDRASEVEGRPEASR